MGPELVARLNAALGRDAGGRAAVLGGAAARVGAAGLKCLQFAATFGAV